MATLNNERDILLILQAIQKDPKFSIRRAAAIYNIPFSILQARRAGRISRRDNIPNSRIITDLEKDVIIKHVFDLDARAFPPRIANVEAMANLLRAAGRNALGLKIRRPPTRA
jgi:hypothetical protein